MTAEISRVLVVEDDFLLADALSDMLTQMGLNVCGIAESADEAVAMASKHKPSLVLTDVRLNGDGDGVDVALEICRMRPCPIIFLTGSQEPATVTRISGTHPAAVLFKPVSYIKLKQTVLEVQARHY
jgi:two-component system, response regulator PdtaR